jgi:Domain of unknown function (DUF6268)
MAHNIFFWNLMVKFAYCTVEKFICFLFISLLAACSESSAQYYTELFSLNQQSYLYRSPTSLQLSNLACNAVIPIVRKNGDVFLIRNSFEQIEIQQSAATDKLWSLALPMGYQWTSKKWSNLRWLSLVIPKWAGGNHRSFSDASGWQYGIYALATWTKSPTFKYKLGMYINQEFFGTFVVPLIGLDWKVNERFQIFGTLPNSMKLHYQLKPNRWNIALAYRSMTRSFRNELSNHWVRYNEMGIKALLEFQIKQSFLFAEWGYFLGKSPRLFNQMNPEVSQMNPIYSGQSNFWMFNVGYAFRLNP